MTKEKLKTGRRQNTGAKVGRKRPNPPSKHAKIPKTVPAVAPTNTFERLDTVSRITSSLFYKFHCEWNVHSVSYGSDPSKIKCKRKFFSAAEATDHLVTHHATKLINSGAELRCCWEKCAHGETEFADKEELKQHIAQHAQATTDSTCTDEDFIPELDEKKSKKRKKTTPENKAAKVSKINPVPERANASNVVTKVMDACSILYRFSCEWNVTGAVYGMSTNSNNNKIMCKRKFTKIDEARDHLVNHHAARVLTTGLALQCCWQSCDVEFSDGDELKEHVVVHAEEPSSLADKCSRLQNHLWLLR